MPLRSAITEVAWTTRYWTKTLLMATNSCLRFVLNGKMRRKKRPSPGFELLCAALDWFWAGEGALLPQCCPPSAICLEARLAAAGSGCHGFTRKIFSTYFYFY